MPTDPDIQAIRELIEREYEFLEQQGAIGGPGKCAAAIKVRDAHLRDRDEDGMAAMACVSCHSSLQYGRT